MRRNWILLALGTAALLAVAGWRVIRILRQPRTGFVTLSDAWARVQKNPGDAKAWGALADAQSHLDQLTAAESSYHTALRLGGDQATLYGRLGFVLYEHGDDLEALRALRRARKLGAAMPLLNETIASLERHHPETLSSQPPSAPAPPGHAPPERAQETATEDEAKGEAPVAENAAHGSGPCSLEVSRAGPQGAFVVPVSLNGHPTRLIIDTGASMTTLSAETVTDIGLAPDTGNPVNAVTATGAAMFPTVRPLHLELGGRSVDDLTGAVCQGCGGNVAGGLLGLDAQAALGMDLDPTAGVIRFHNCL
jgi:hypothetical protein